jgi:corrinoid protein of di/trimethylamine methyltransferase
MLLKDLSMALESGNVTETESLIRRLIEEQFDPAQIFSAMTETMSKVGDEFSRMEIFLPEMMMAGEAMSSAIRIIGPLMGEKERKGIAKGRVILGTVKGDIHEIGKNIVKMMLEGSGFQVKDIGEDVESRVFVREAERMHADFIAASALMTTTMIHQKEIISILEEEGLRDKYKVVIGGAPTSQIWADEIGADLYCFDAGSAPRRMSELLTGG